MPATSAGFPSTRRMLTTCPLAGRRAPAPKVAPCQPRAGRCPAPCPGARGRGPSPRWTGPSTARERRACCEQRRQSGRGPAVRVAKWLSHDTGGNEEFYHLRDDVVAVAARTLCKRLQLCQALRLVRVREILCPRVHNTVDPIPVGGQGSLMNGRSLAMCCGREGSHEWRLPCSSEDSP